MKRFALEKLKEWKTKPNRKPLIIRGARQVGKTWLMKEFGRTCFENVAYVNFDSNTRMQQVFEGEISIERIVLAISAETGISIDAQNTLLIFDEVQEVPKALSSLKYFCENAPEYAIVAAAQPASAISGIRVIFLYVPLVVFAIMFIILLFYKLDKEYGHIVEDLEKRAKRA